MAKEQKPAWVYLLAGLIIGLFVAFLVFLGQQEGTTINFKTAAEETANKHNSKDTREVRTDNQEAPSGPELSFYDMLPELEVSVSPDLDVNIGSKPRQSTPAPKPVEKPTATPTDIGGELYYLQVGAFSKFQGADKQKVELLLSNWPAKVQQVRKSSGTSIYRVFVGPYRDGTELSKAEKGLKKQGLKPVRHKANS